MVVQRTVKAVKESTLSERVIASALAGLFIAGVVGGVVMYGDLREIKATVINSAGDIEDVKDDMESLQSQFRNHGHPPR